MQLGPKTNGERGIGRVVLVALMLSLWLGTSALAASPQLHHWFHKDSKSVTHECLVTLLSKSHLLASSGGVALLIAAPVFFGLLLTGELFSFTSIDYRLSPSRAPPATCSSITVAG